MYRNGIGAYKKTDVTTSHPMKLVIMCYEEAIRNLEMAKDAYVDGKYEMKLKALEKAEAIISELASALDFEKGGQIAENLSALYAYMLRCLTHADLKREVKAFGEVAGMLEELKRAWEGIFYGEKGDLDMPPAHLPERSGNQAASTEFAPQVRP